jgi:ketosteroid isomerase-like protein
MPKYAVYQTAAPYFDLVRRALGDLVDGNHFFDIVTEDVIYEVLYDVPGWPRVIKGRTDLMAAFRGYVDTIALHSADELIIHKTDDGRVVVIEYEVHGTIVATGMKYNNRFCSIIKIEKRKIAHWRDYMDSLAAWNALTAKVRGNRRPGGA